MQRVTQEHSQEGLCHKKRVLRGSIFVLMMVGLLGGFLCGQEKFSYPLIPRDVLFGNPERGPANFAGRQATGIPRSGEWSAECVDPNNWKER